MLKSLLMPQLIQILEQFREDFALSISKSHVNIQTGPKIVKDYSLYVIEFICYSAFHLDLPKIPPDRLGPIWSP